ncbi:uncharacterized protein BDW70DRAFT_57655 [Aspergillus foveolatus]|uniref:uncharacterized protein n=1 Tax=Aspergillus foveolatus TaxID=210207 RepID=UPI003CCC9167
MQRKHIINAYPTAYVLCFLRPSFIQHSSMDSWHRNVRLLHQIDEFLDIDSTQPHFVSDFVALIDAVREGLYVIDEDIKIPDSQINLHFLTKLKSRPEWREWALAMLRDSRINASNLTDCMSFRELADLAVKQEQMLLQQRRDKRESGSARKVSFAQSEEEINEYVIQQMRRDREQTARARRSYSQPPKHNPNHLQAKPMTARCSFCGDTYHQSTNCWRRWRVTAEALQGHPPPKLIESRNGLFAQPRIYLSY